MKRADNPSLQLLVLLAPLVASLLCGCVGEGRVEKLEARVDALTERLDKARFRRVTIIDGKGRTRATLGMRDDGTPHLEFLDPDSRNRILLRLQPDGSPVLVMFGATAKSAPGEKGQGAKKAEAEQDDRRASAFLAVHGQGPPQMMMFDKAGTQTFKVP